VLGIFILIFTWLSFEFAYLKPWLDRPTNLIVLTLILAGSGYLLLLVSLRKGDFLSLTAIVLSGLFLRVFMVPSTPVFEDDFYRYFWDAELTAQGINPYSIAPIDALPSPFPEDAQAEKNPQFKPLEALVYLDRVAYPTIRTIYPPVTQAMFALSHWIAPANLLVWRSLLLVFDCVSVFLLGLLLRQLGKNSKWVAVYWLNPMMIVTTINGAHMDVLLIPFLIGTALFALKHRFTVSGLLLATAVGVKLWPVILAPLIFKPLFKYPKQLLASAIPFALVCGLLVTPQLATQLDPQAGLVAYSSTWHTNAFVYTLIQKVMVFALGLGTTGWFDPLLLSRLVVLVGVGTVLVFFTQSIKDDPDKYAQSLIVAILGVTATLFLLSPTGYPWYFLWLLPWLAIRPNAGLLLLTATLPIYYLRYPLSINNESQLFDNYWVTLEFLPSLLLIAYGLLRTANRDR